MSRSNIILIVVWGIILLAVLVYFLYNRRKKNKDESIDFSFMTEGRKMGYTAMFYRFFQNAPFFRKEFQKLQNRVRMLYPSDEMSINREVTKIMTRAFFWFVLILVGSILLSRGDVFFILFGIFTALLVFRSNTTSKLDAADQRILQQFSEFISGLIPTYREKHGHLEDAIYAMLDELPQLISLHLSRIYEILISPRIEQEAESYMDYAPNSFLLSFVSLAVPVKVYGDKTLPDGNTAFLKGLMNLKKEMNEEIIKRSSIDLAFSSLTIIAISAIFMLKPVEWFFMQFMPQTVTFFHGPWGMAIMTLIFLTSYASYLMIISLRTSKREDIKEVTIWSRIAAFPLINALLNIQLNRHYTRLNRTEKRLRATGDHTGVKAFIVRSTACALAAFIGFHILFVGAGIQASGNALNEFSTEFDNVVVPDSSYTDEMVRVSRIIAKEHKNDITLNKEIISQEIRDHSLLLKSDMYVEPVADVVIKQVRKYQGIFFRWWYEPIILALSAAAFFIPTLFLLFKSHQIQMNKEDEVNSFNLLALIFMDMEGTQVSTLLEWMERFSYSYRDAITECITSLEMGEKAALKKLYEYDDMFEFRKFVKSLMSVDEVGFKRAFADIQIQQDYYNDKRKLDNQRMITRKSILASRIAFIPMYMVIVLYLILPMVLYGLTLMTQLMGAVNSI